MFNKKINQMRKFLFISIMLTLFAVTASAGRAFYPPDVGTEQTITVAQPVTNYQVINIYSSEVSFSPTTVVFMPAEKTEIYNTVTRDAWRNPDWGGSLAIQCSYNKLNSIYTDIGSIRATHNYNVDYSYGLRN